MSKTDPPVNCRRCARLTSFRKDNRAQNPQWFNGAVPSFGPKNANLLIVGLAPGLKGANRTGRVFTGDASGEMLFAMLKAHGFSQGVFENRSDDGLHLKNTMITNAVRCVPPQNKPISTEIKNCEPFLRDQILALPRLCAILCLGRVAHYAVLSALAIKQKQMAFKHGASACFSLAHLGAKRGAKNPITLFDSYHCSRYNINTGRLTAPMFDEVFSQVKRHIEKQTTS